MIDRFKVPSNTVTLTPSDFDHAKSTSVPDALLQRVPSVSINDTAVNPFQPDVQYRGFTASPTLGTAQGLAIYGFFQNAGTPRRRGIEAAAEYQSDRWKVYTSYSYIDATFQDVFEVSSPNNPRAINGVITVTPGNVIPSIPAHRVKAGFDYAVFDNWKVGADLIGVSGQYLRGDESNLNPMLPRYWVLNLHTTYQVSKQVELLALVQNLTDQHILRDQRHSVPQLHRSTHAQPQCAAHRVCGFARQARRRDDTRQRPDRLQGANLQVAGRERMELGRLLSRRQYWLRRGTRWSMPLAAWRSVGSRPQARSRVLVSLVLRDS